MNAKGAQTIGYLANFRVQTYVCLHPPAPRDTGARKRSRACTHARSLASSVARSHAHVCWNRNKRRKDDDSLKLCRQRNLSYHITHIQACEASALLSLDHPANSGARGLKTESNTNESRAVICNKQDQNILATLTVSLIWKV